MVEEMVEGEGEVVEADDVVVVVEFASRFFTVCRIPLTGAVGDDNFVKLPLNMHFKENCSIIYTTSAMQTRKYFEYDGIWKESQRERASLERVSHSICFSLSCARAHTSFTTIKKTGISA